MTHFKTGRLRYARGRSWKPFWEKHGWKIEVRLASGRMRLRDAFRLVDHQGRIHQVLKIKDPNTAAEIFNRLRRLQAIRRRTHYLELAEHFPNPREVAQILQEDPENSNARFCAVAHALRRDRPDWVIVTGDLTDDGSGYELLKAGLAPFIERRRLLCLPGNHDVYSTPPLWNDRHFIKPTSEKRRDWNKFLASTGMVVEGGSVCHLGAGVVAVIFDSCFPSKVPGSVSGAIPPNQLRLAAKWLANNSSGALRLACLHHPVQPVRLRGLNLAFRLAMRLRNAKRVLAGLREMEFDVVMDGHRHIGCQFQSSSGPVFLSSPSTTYGCRLGAKPFYWQLDIRQVRVHSIQKVKIEALKNL